MDQISHLKSQDSSPTQRRERRFSARREHQANNDALLNVDGSAPTESAFDEAALIRLPAVLRRVGMGRTAVYEQIKAGNFPRPVKVGAASKWIDVEITRWIEKLAASRARST